MITDFNSGIDISGLSTDTITGEYPNATRFHEIDTGKVYLYDKENDDWYDASGNKRGAETS